MILSDFVDAVLSVVKDLWVEIISGRLWGLKNCEWVRIEEG